MGSLPRHDAAPSHPKARSKGRPGPSSPPPNLDVRNSSRAVGKGAGQGYALESVGGLRGSLERGVVDGVVAVGERRVDPNARLCDDFLRGQRRVNTAGQRGSADVHREATVCTTRMCCGWACGEPVASQWRAQQEGGAGDWWRRGVRNEANSSIDHPQACTCCRASGYPVMPISRILPSSLSRCSAGRVSLRMMSTEGANSGSCTYINSEAAGRGRRIHIGLGRAFGTARGAPASSPRGRSAAA